MACMVFLSQENPTSLPRPCFRFTFPDTPSLSTTDPTSLGHHRGQASLELSHHNAYFIAHCSGHHESVSPSRTGHSMACTAGMGEQMKNARLCLPGLPGGGQMDTRITRWLLHTRSGRTPAHTPPRSATFRAPAARCRLQARHTAHCTPHTWLPAGPAHTTHIAPCARRTQTPASTRLLRGCSSRPSPSLLVPRS